MEQIFKKQKLKKKGILVHIYANPLRDNNNARLMRIVESLNNSGIFEKVYVLAVHENGQRIEEELFDNVFIRRFPNLFKKKTSFFAKVLNNIVWLINIKCWTLFKNVGIVNHVGAINLLTLPYFKLIKRSRVFYYADDIVTENRIGGIIEKIYKIVEKRFLKYCDEIIVVSEGSKKWYEDTYKIKDVKVVWNATIKSPEMEIDKTYDVRKLYGLNENDLVFGYIGTFTTGRSIEMLLDVFPKLERNKHLVLAGYGELENLVKRKAGESSNIHYLGSISWDKVQSFVTSIDVGVILLEDVCLNYRYTLATKFFEYLALGKPVLVSSPSSMTTIVDKYNLGWETIVQEESIFKLISELRKQDIEEKRYNAQKNADKFLWQEQEKNLLKIYNK